MDIFPIVPKVTRYRSYEGYAWLLLGIFLYVPKVTRLQKLRRLRRASSGDFLLCPQSYEVTEVTKVTQASYGYFSYCPQSYEVTEVTKVTQGFRWIFFLLSPKLQGYRSYEGYAELLMEIFPLVCKVTMLFGNFQIVSSKSYEVTEVTRVTQGF